MSALTHWPVYAIILGFAGLYYAWYLHKHPAGGRRAPRRVIRDDTPAPETSEQAIARTIAGATTAGYLSAETIPIAATENDPPWPPAPELSAATAWPGLQRGEVLLPLPEPGDAMRLYKPAPQYADAVKKHLAGLPPQRDRWNAGDHTVGLVVEPGWYEHGEVDDPAWAQVHILDLDDMLGYAYPDGFPPCHHDPAARHDALFGTAPWPDPPAASAAEAEALRFLLDTTTHLTADKVFELMGGDR